MCESTNMPGGEVYWREFGDTSMVVPAGSMRAMANTGEVEAAMAYVPTNGGGYMCLGVAAAPGAIIEESPAMGVQANEPSVFVTVAAEYAMFGAGLPGFMGETDDPGEPDVIVIDQDLLAAS